MIGILITLIGLLLLVIGLILAGRTHSRVIAEIGEFIATCGCLILIGMVAFYGVTTSLARLQ